MRVEDSEYTIRIECDDASRPELGFTTEPNRLTREATGRSNMVRLRLRLWQQTGDVMVTLDRYVAWMLQPTSVGGAPSGRTGRRNATTMRNNQPTPTTYEMWTSGDRPEGLDSVEFEARCGVRDLEAPSYRRLGDR